MDFVKFLLSQHFSSIYISLFNVSWIVNISALYKKHYFLKENDEVF